MSDVVRKRRESRVCDKPVHSSAMHVHTCII